MKRFIPIMGFLLVGCASVQQSAETTSGNGTTNRVTRINVKTLFDSKQVISALKASNGATHNLGAAGVEQESSSRVIATTMEAAISGAIKALVPPPTVPAK